MKKIWVIASLLLTFNVMAADGDLTKLLPGKQVLIDVANHEVVALLIYTNNPDTGLLPLVTIEKSWSGFECSHKATILRRANHNFKSFEIQIDWSPGADLSGCIVNVSFPGMKDSRAELYMNY